MRLPGLRMKYPRLDHSVPGMGGSLEPHGASGLLVSAEVSMPLFVAPVVFAVIVRGASQLRSLGLSGCLALCCLLLSL